ncbi:MAG: DUF1080 domain-containing protein [Verrucomicrobia bacterium]|nr:DUF1080 domain-containing protein [Verrucomicrobiota bacterium]
MNKTLLPVAVAIAGLACSLDLFAETGLSALELFNGKDLAGWKSFVDDPKVKQEQVWSARGGVIVCKGEPMGYLYTERQFTNFKLEAEYRWAGKPGNSGLFARIGGEPRALPRCIETQLKHGNAGDLFGFHGFPLRGAADRSSEKESKLAGHVSIVKRIAGNEKEPGQWNKMELLVSGANVTVWLNGQKVNEATGAEVKAGPVGLQSEGGEVHFRNVRLTPLAK